MEAPHDSTQPESCAAALIAVAGTYTSVGVNITSHTISGLKASYTYYWRVHAMNDWVVSGYSNIASVTTQSAIVSADAAPFTPSGLVVTNLPGKKMSLNNF
jgi:hypothetical protein